MSSIRENGSEAQGQSWRKRKGRGQQSGPDGVGNEGISKDDNLQQSLGKLKKRLRDTQRLLNKVRSEIDKREPLWIWNI